MASLDHWLDDSGVSVIKISGEIDISNVERLQRAIDPLTATAPEHLVFDLSDLQFVDSSGLALLLATSRKAGTVQLRRPTPIVRRIVEISGLGDVLPTE